MLWIPSRTGHVDWEGILISGSRGAAGKVVPCDSSGVPLDSTHQSYVVETPRTIVANQSIAYTDTHGVSSAVNASTTEVIVTLTTDGYIAIGAAPVATTGSMFLPAYVPSPPLKVTGGTSKVSAIRDASSGTMKIAEFSR